MLELRKTMCVYVFVCEDIYKWLRAGESETHETNILQNILTLKVLLSTTKDLVLGQSAYSLERYIVHSENVPTVLRRLICHSERK